jgi:RHS repeat-associated protein
MATSTDGAGSTTTFGYDKLDRTTSAAFSGGITPTVTFVYDGAGRITSRVDGNGTTTYTYDHLGHLTSVTNTAGGGTIRYTYDKAGALASVADARGSTSYSYDASHAVSGISTQDAVSRNVNIHYTYDAAGRTTDISFSQLPISSSNAVNYHVDRDTSGRITRLTAKDPLPTSAPKTMADFSYCYAAGSAAPACSTAASNDRSKVQWVKNNLSGLVVAYTYDAAGRLTRAAGSGTSSAKTYTYTYDGNGNRKTASDGTSTQNLTFNSGNEITSTGYAHDGAGNLTLDPAAGALAYDAAGRMTSSIKQGVTSTYKYAGLGQNELLSTTSSNGRAASYVYGRADRNGLPIVEQMTRDGRTTYVEHDPSGTPVASRSSDGTWTFYAHDGLGSPDFVSGQGSTLRTSVEMYDPYGVPIRPVRVDAPSSFADGLPDYATGLVKFGARYYSPASGRFTQQDSVVSLADPAEGNRFAYAADDPVNSADPTGNLSCRTLYLAMAGIFVLDIVTIASAIAAILSGNVFLLVGEAALIADEHVLMEAAVDAQKEKGC